MKQTEGDPACKHRIGFSELQRLVQKPLSKQQFLHHGSQNDNKEHGGHKVRVEDQLLQ